MARMDAGHDNLRMGNCYHYVMVKLVSVMKLFSSTFWKIDDANVQSSILLSYFPTQLITQPRVRKLHYNDESSQGFREEGTSVRLRSVVLEITCPRIWEPALAEKPNASYGTSNVKAKGRVQGKRKRTIEALRDPRKRCSIFTDSRFWINSSLFLKFTWVNPSWSLSRLNLPRMLLFGEATFFLLQMLCRI